MDASTSTNTHRNTHYTSENGSHNPNMYLRNSGSNVVKDEIEKVTEEIGDNEWMYS